MSTLFSLLLLSPSFAASRAADGAIAAPVSGWLGDYEAIRVALVLDHGAEASGLARALVAHASADADLAARAEVLAGSADDASRRAAFGELSRVAFERVAADPDAPKLYAYHCTMFGGFAYWLQTKPGLKDPYMGQSMPDCGEQVSVSAAVRAAESAP